MTRLVAFAALAALCFVPAVRADDTKLDSRDEKFIKMAATAGETEVALGKVAATHAQSDEVKKFGQTMIDDHSKANLELKDLAKNKNVDLAEAEEKATKDESKDEKKLEKKSGADFDKAYINRAVKDHEEVVKAFETASSDAKDADVKAWASKTLPTLQHHLEMAKDIKSRVK